jgi:ABC-type phosphate transport system auxiliary subunit|tara:strand:+ start:1051 stop:1299 length:249 start_codon:yes stop_codon:yes gene_type:complete
MAKKEKTVTADEFRAERDKLERDRSMLNERLQALNAEREKTTQQLVMVAGALQTVSAFINRLDPEVDPEDEIDMSTSDPDEV